MIPHYFCPICKHNLFECESLREKDKQKFSCICDEGHTHWILWKEKEWWIFDVNAWRPAEINERPYYKGPFIFR